MPDELAEVLHDLSAVMRRFGEVLTDQQVTDTYIAGLTAATGQKWEHAKVWSGGTKGHMRPLPFVAQGRCPFGHRTEDRTDYANVRFIVDDDWWLTLDPASPCTHCTREALERWALTCPLCEAGMDHERHFPNHAPLDVLADYDLSEEPCDDYPGVDYSGKPDDFEYTDMEDGGFDASPIAWVMREFVRQAKVAAARWWIEHTDEAVAEFVPLGIQDRQRFISDRLVEAREVLGAQPKITRASSKPMMTPEAGAAWLDKTRVPVMGEKATWAQVKDLPGCPAQSVIYAAVKLRKRRTTEP